MEFLFSGFSSGVHQSYRDWGIDQRDNTFHQVDAGSLIAVVVGVVHDKANFFFFAQALEKVVRYFFYFVFMIGCYFHRPNSYKNIDI